MVKALNKGPKVSLILNARLNGVGVKDLPWKKKKKDKPLCATNFCFSRQISMFMLNGKIFPLVILQQVEAETG